MKMKLNLLLGIFFGLLMWILQDLGIIRTFVESELTENRFIESPYIVEVGGHQFTSKDLEWETKFHLMNVAVNQSIASGHENSEDLVDRFGALRDNLLADMIERKMLITYLKSDQTFDTERPELYTNCIDSWQKAINGNVVDPALINIAEDQERLKERICEWDVISKYFDEKIFQKVEIHDDEIEAYYRNNKSDFAKEVEVEIRQIVLASESEANRVMSRIHDSNFAELARKHSIAPEAAEGGKLRRFAKGEMPGSFNIAFSMEIGEVRGVIKSMYGFHIIKLEHKFLPEKLTIKENLLTVRTKLLQEKKQAAYKKWVELAMNAVPIKTPERL